MFTLNEHGERLLKAMLDELGDSVYEAIMIWRADRSSMNYCYLMSDMPISASYLWDSIYIGDLKRSGAFIDNGEHLGIHGWERYHDSKVNVTQLCNWLGLRVVDRVLSNRKNTVFSEPFAFLGDM